MSKDALRARLEDVFNRAMECGDRAATHKEYAEVVRQQKEAVGTTPLYAYALFCMATLASQLGDFGEAVLLLQEATSIAVPEDEDHHQNEKDRLTFLMNLGDLLTASGKLSEAEEVLVAGVAARVEFYGDGHPGVAFGLQSLAECLYAQGKAAEGFSAVHSAFQINAAAGQSQVAENLALRAFCSAAVDDSVDPFPDWGRCPAGLNAAIVKRCITTSAGYVKERGSAAPASIVVMKNLSERLGSAGLGEGETPLKLRLGVANQLFNIAQLAHDAQVSLDACTVCLDLAKEEGVPFTIVHAHMGKAVALEGVGASLEDVNAEYVTAAAVAEEHNQPELVAKVYRNQALTFKGAGDASRARRAFEQALEAAEGSGDVMVEGSVLAAFGIFLQHAQVELDRAKELLTKAVRILPPGSDRFSSLSHLTALDTEGACGCDAQSSVAALSQMLEAIVRKSFPSEDLLEKVGFVEADSGKLDLNVQLARKPTPEEEQELERVIRLAQVELQSKME